MSLKSCAQCCEPHLPCWLLRFVACPPAFGLSRCASCYAIYLCVHSFTLQPARVTALAFRAALAWPGVSDRQRFQRSAAEAVAGGKAITEPVSPAPSFESAVLAGVAAVQALQTAFDDESAAARVSGAPFPALPTELERIAADLFEQQEDNPDGGGPDQVLQGEGGGG
jgi:hypothetical protein